MDRSDIAAAAAVAQVFAAYLVVMHFVAPPDADNWLRADPILKIAPRGLTLWSVPVASVLVAAVWWRLARVSRVHLSRAAVHAIAGVAAATAAAGAMRIIAGPTLPSFIPAEESAGPGYLLSMTAGYGEEVFVRFIALPLAYFAARRRLKRGPAIAVAVVFAALVFALWHDAGPDPSSGAYFVTRFMVPGVAMSVAFFVVSPTFIVVTHSAAHLLIPTLFV